MDKEAVLKEAIATAKLWEARYGASEQSRQQYRQACMRVLMTCAGSDSRFVVECVTTNDRE